MKLTIANMARGALASVALLSLGACADSSLPSSTRMQLGAPAYAPRGYVKFCERRPDQCGLPTPMQPLQRASLERQLIQQQWANIFDLKPTSIRTAANPAVLISDNHTPVIDPAAATLQGGAEAALDALTPQLLLDTEASTQSASVSPLSPPGPPMLGLEVLTHPAEASSVVVRATPLVWDVINGINQSINARIKPMEDEEAFGQVDYWTLPLSDGPRAVGNCKHYALEKRKALVEAGFSVDALSIAIVETPWGETHAVLVVSTDQGDYILDNLTPWIKAWREVSYHWIERQVPGQPLRWAMLAPPTKLPQPVS